MKLFNLDDTYTVTFEAEIFLLDSFKKLKESRKKDISKLYKEMSYIYFFCDMSSDFQYQPDEKLRTIDIKKYVKLPEKWKPDAILESCIETYNHLSQTISSKLLKSVYIAVDKVGLHLETVDLTERDKNMKPVFNQKDVIASVKQIPDLLKAIRQAESEYVKNKEINEKLRGGKIQTMYEKGFSGVV